METIKAGVLFPDTLYLHGERGNQLALKRVAKEAGYDLDVEKITMADDFHPLDYDILFMPAGELVRAQAVREKLMPVRNELIGFIESGRPLIVIGTSAAFFGDEITYRNGDKTQGLGLIPVDFHENDAVYGDDLWYKAKYHGKSFELVGNQIMMADWERKGGKPFGSIRYGYGNKKGPFEGVMMENSVFTNTLGPLLVLNPDFTLEVIRTAAENKHIKTEEQPVDMTLEMKGRDARKAFIRQKRSALENTDFDR